MLELIGRGYSSQDLRTVEVLEQLKNLATRLAPGEPSIEAAIKGEVRRGVSDTWDLAKAAFREMSGAVAFSDQRASVCRSYLIWGDRRVASIVGLEVSSPRDSKELERIVDAFRELTIDHPLHYFHTRSIDEEEGLPPGNQGLEAGLYDIYWMNGFGQPFIDLIGRERLLDLAAEVEEVRKNFVLVRTTEWPPNPDSEEWLQKKEDLRNALGEDYFVNQEKLQEYLKVRRGEDAEGVIGWRTLFSLIRAAKRSEALETEFWAEKRPTLDR